MCSSVRRSAHASWATGDGNGRASVDPFHSPHWLKSGMMINADRILDSERFVPFKPRDCEWDSQAELFLSKIICYQCLSEECNPLSFLFAPLSLQNMSLRRLCWTVLGASVCVKWLSTFVQLCWCLLYTLDRLAELWFPFRVLQMIQFGWYEWLSCACEYSFAQGWMATLVEQSLLRLS